MNDSQDDQTTCDSGCRPPKRRFPKCGGRSGGPGLGTLLTVLFVGLKLTGHIDWSWWWVLAPTWIGFLFALLAIALVIVAKKHAGAEPSGET